jgi:hypothetical protein
LVLHDLSPASDAALLFALREIYLHKEGHGVDVIVVSVASDAVVKRTKLGATRQRTGSFSRLFSGQRRGSNSSAAKPAAETEADEKMLEDACAEFGIERDDGVLVGPTKEEEAVGTVLEERVAKTVVQAGITWKVR